MSVPPIVDIRHSESLAGMAELEPRSVDAIVTDPPYAQTTEAASTISRTRRQVREMQFFEAWIREQIAAMARVLKPTGAIWMSIDWRGALAVDEACARLNMREPIVGVWDKETIGMGYLMRRSYECFLVVPMDAFDRKTASETDVWRVKWGGQRDRITDHAAEKPPELMRRALRLIASPGDLVLDPYCGSGSTGAAALSLGMSFIGIERDAAHVETARRRLSSVSSTATGQRALGF